MRILIIQGSARWPSHLETEVEIAETHLESGDQVEFLGCDACVPVCYANPEGVTLACDECRAINATGIALLSKKCLQHKLSDYITESTLDTEMEKIASINDVETAKNFTLNGHDLGWGAYSSTISATRDYLCESKQARSKLQLFASTAYRTYSGTKNFLSRQDGYDRVYVFNGRFAATRGALRACEECDSVGNIQIHERGSSKDKYEIFGPNMPHHRETRRRMMEEAWDTAEARVREEEGSSFFEARRLGTPTDWKSFISLQESGHLPSTLTQQRINVAIFNSSEDEYAGIGKEWQNTLYASQFHGISRITQDALERYPEMHFFLRIHPNLIGVNHSDVRETRQMSSPNLTVIPGDAKTSTYDLVEAVDKVITFGSTVGIEATYWGTPSIVARHAMYENIDAAYFPQSHAELMDLLGEELEPKPRINALKFGYYFKTFGKEFKYYSAESLTSGKFRNVNLRGRSKLEKLVIKALSKLGRGEYRFRTIMARLRRRRAEAKLKH